MSASKEKCVLDNSFAISVIKLLDNKVMLKDKEIMLLKQKIKNMRRLYARKKISSCRANLSNQPY